jgi:uncharacterized protein YdhG (YjbR/CyaY superfamily)
MSMKPKSVEEYLASLPEDRRAVVESMRATARASAPEAVETIAYDMPALRTTDGRFLVSYAAYRGHYSLFPSNPVVNAEVGPAIEPYLAGRGTIRFPAKEPVPLDLVKKVVAARVKEVGQKPDR